MDLIARDTETAALVAREEGEPYWYPPATAPAARAQVWKLNKGQPYSSAVLVGVFDLGPDYDIDFNPVTDRNVLLGIITLSADGTPSVSRLEDAVWAEVLFERETTPVKGIEPHVPTVTKPPTIAQAGENLDMWVVLTPAPDEYGGTVQVGEIKIEKADDASVSEVWSVSLAKQHLIPKKGYPCKIYYRWLNQSEEDIGGGRGWSAWSPSQNAAESGVAIAPVADALPTVDFDENDSLAPIRKEIIL